MQIIELLPFFIVSPLLFHLHTDLSLRLCLLEYCFSSACLVRSNAKQQQLLQPKIEVYGEISLPSKINKTQQFVSILSS